VWSIILIFLLWYFQDSNYIQYFSHLSNIVLYGQTVSVLRLPPCYPGFKSHHFQIFFNVFIIVLSLNSHTNSSVKFTQTLFELSNAEFVWNVTQEFLECIRTEFTISRTGWNKMLFDKYRIMCKNFGTQSRFFCLKLIYNSVEIYNKFFFWIYQRQTTIFSFTKHFFDLLLEIWVSPIHLIIYRNFKKIHEKS
jgi:hypothetical protein